MIREPDNDLLRGQSVETPSAVAVLDDPADLARSIYDSQLRDRLEPDYNGQFVAIHPGTGDYVVEPRFGKAFRALEVRHPEEAIVVRYIGIAGSGLRRRLLGEKLI